MSLPGEYLPYCATSVICTFSATHNRLMLGMKQASELTPKDLYIPMLTMAFGLVFLYPETCPRYGTVVLLECLGEFLFLSPFLVTVFARAQKGSKSASAARLRFLHTTLSLIRFSSVKDDRGQSESPFPPMCRP